MFRAIRKYHIILIILLPFYSCKFLYAQTKPKIDLISPSSSYELIVGKRQSITWISYDTLSIDIQYSIDTNNWINIFHNINSSLESIGWKVPNIGGNKLKVRILSSDKNQILSVSDGWISVFNYQTSQPALLNSTDAQTLKILPLGNSITFDNRSGDTRPVEQKIGYRFPLYQLLMANNIDFDFIGSEHAGSSFLPAGFDDNAGFPGIRDDELAHLLQTGILNMPFYGVLDTITPGPYLETYLPDIILLHIGTNGNSLIPESYSSNDVEDVLDEIKRVEDLFGKNIEVMVARIIDRVPNQPYVKIFNDNVELMVQDRISNPLNDAFPDHLTIVDMQNGAGLLYNISPDPNGTPGCMNDMLHPNDLGYQLMASKWFTRINALQKSSGSGIVSYWQFDEILASNFGDDLKLNDGSCTNCPSIISGMNNNSVSFDGSTEIILSNTNSLNTNLSGSFSIEAWIQTEHTASGNKVIIGKYNGGSNSSWWLGVNGDDSLAVFSVRSSTVTDNVQLNSTSKIIDGKWHHIVGIKDIVSSQLRIYVDGVLEGTVPTNFTGIFTGDADLTIGSYINSFNLNGNIDELIIFDRILTDSEINSHFSMGKIGEDVYNDTTLALSVDILIEGSYNSFNNNLTTSLNSALPIYQPYNDLINNYNGAESVNAIPNSDIVDWVLVELRNLFSSSSVVASRAGFLTKAGTIVDLDGTSALTFSANYGSYYVVVKHRNHLTAMSHSKLTFSP